MQRAIKDLEHAIGEMEARVTENKLNVDPALEASIIEDLKQMQEAMIDITRRLDKLTGEKNL